MVATSRRRHDVAAGWPVRHHGPMNKLLSICLTLTLGVGVGAQGAHAQRAHAAPQPPSTTAQPPPADPQASPADLHDRVFTSILTRQDGQPRPLVPGTAIRLSFTASRLVATAGCNTMSGPVTLTADTIVVTDLAVTEMACASDRHEQDAWLAAFLAADPTWSSSGPTLTLRGGTVEIVLGERLPAVAGQPLLNRYWIVDTVLGDRVVYPVPPGIHVHLLFRQTSGGDAVSVTGTLICNLLTGSGTVRDDTITIDGIGTTKRGCRPDDPRVHTGVLTALRGTSNFWIDGDQATIAKPTGPGLIMHAAF